MAVTIVSDIYQKIDDVINTTLGSKTAEVINIISPVIMSAFILYVLLVAMSYMKNNSDITEIGGDLIQRFIGWSVVIGLSMNIGNFTSIVVPMVNGIPQEIMQIFNGGTAGTGIETQLDTLIDGYIETLTTGWDNASGIESSIIALVVSLVVVVCGILSVVITSSYLLLAKLVVAVLLVIAPIFISLALFPTTRQYASLWVAQVVNFGLLLILTSVVASVQLALLNALTGSELTWTYAFQLAVTSGVFIVIFMKIPEIASALSGGMVLNGYNQTGRAVAGGAKTAGGAVKGAGAGASAGVSGGSRAYGWAKGRFGGGNTIKPEGAGK